MQSTVSTIDIWKEGVFTFMKSFFLYFKMKVSNNKHQDYKGIYMFDNHKLLAINKDVYKKEDRLSLQSELGMRPYYITQSIFKEILLFLLKNDKHSILLMNIHFIDESIEELIEYTDLSYSIRNKEINKVYEYVFDIMDTYDTDINDITIRYKGCDFFISKEGVITTDASDEVLKFFTADKIINNLILGIY